VIISHLAGDQPFSYYLDRGIQELFENEDNYRDLEREMLIKFEDQLNLERN